MRICVALFWSFTMLNLPKIMHYQVNTGLKNIEDYSVVLSCSSVHVGECVMGYWHLIDKPNTRIVHPSHRVGTFMERVLPLQFNTI